MTNKNKENSAIAEPLGDSRVVVALILWTLSCPLRRVVFKLTRYISIVQRNLLHIISETGRFDYEQVHWSCIHS
jgi:hypothetical protein